MPIIDKEEINKEIDTILAILNNKGIVELKIEGIGEKGKLTVVEIRRTLKSKR